jgi:hypothetical protein
MVSFISDHFTHKERVLSTHSVGDYGETKNLYLVLCPVPPACSWTVLYWLKLMFQHLPIINTVHKFENCWNEKVILGIMVDTPV